MILVPGEDKLDPGAVAPVNHTEHGQLRAVVTADQGDRRPSLAEVAGPPDVVVVS